MFILLITVRTYIIELCMHFLKHTEFKHLFVGIEIQNNHWERARSRGSLKIGQLTEKDSSALLTSLITASNLKLLEKIGQGAGKLYNSLYNESLCNNCR